MILKHVKKKNYPLIFVFTFNLISVLIITTNTGLAHELTKWNPYVIEEETKSVFTVAMS
jgi:hypothetical protein